jgi:hypothetical protein
MKTNKGQQWFENKVVMMVIATFGFEIHLEIGRYVQWGWPIWHHNNIDCCIQG